MDAVFFGIVVAEIGVDEADAGVVDVAVLFSDAGV